MQARGTVQCGGGSGGRRREAGAERRARLDTWIGEFLLGWCRDLGLGGTADVWAPRFGPTCRGAVTEGMLGPACQGAGGTETFRDGNSEEKFEVEGEN